MPAVVCAALHHPATAAEASVRAVAAARATAWAAFALGGRDCLCLSIDSIQGGCKQEHNQKTKKKKKDGDRFDLSMKKKKDGTGAM